MELERQARVIRGESCERSGGARGRKRDNRKFALEKPLCLTGAQMLFVKRVICYSVCVY